MKNRRLAAITVLLGIMFPFLSSAQTDADKIQRNMMKKILLMFAFFLCSYGLKAQEIMYEGETDGVIMLSVSEFNVKKQEAVKNAIVDAYYHILFRGIPGSKENRRALLGTDETITDAQRQYYDNMIEGGRLFSFVNYSNLNYYKKKEAVVKLTINVQSLIDDLERNNLYRRFGLY